jgi:transposase InsO family protein
VLHPQVESAGGKLVERGERVSQERVRRLMALHGLRSVYKRPYRNTTQSNHDKPVAPNLVNRQFMAQQADRIWIADISVPQQAA